MVVVLVVVGWKLALMAGCVSKMCLHPSLHPEKRIFAEKLKTL